MIKIAIEYCDPGEPIHSHSIVVSDEQHQDDGTTFATELALIMESAFSKFGAINNLADALETLIEFDRYGWEPEQARLLNNLSIACEEWLKRDTSPTE